MSKDICFCCKKEFDVKELVIIDERFVCKKCDRLGDKEDTNGEDSV